MNNTLIYIEGELVDVLPSTIVACTFKAFEIGDLTSRNTTFTNRFKLPKTPRNNQIFGLADNINSLTSKPYIKLKGNVVQDGIEVIRNASVILRTTNESYNIELYAGSFNFFDLLGERNVNDLLQAAAPQLTDYPLANSLLELIFFNDGSLNEGTDPMDFAGKHMIKYKDILDQIISENGYSATGNVLSDTTLNALYVLAFAFQDKYNFKFKAPREFEALRDISVVFNATSSDQRINFTNVLRNGGFYDGTNTYEVVDPLHGGTYFFCNAYAVIVIGVIAFAGGATRLRVELFSASATYVINDITAPGTYLLELSDHINLDPLGNPVTKVTGVDGLEIFVEAHTLDAVGTPTGTATVTFGAGTSFKVECLQDNPLPALYVNVGGVLPDLLQRDFMRDFAIRTGCLFRENGSVLECKTIEEILADRASAVDWTMKRDTSKVKELIYEFRNYAQNNYFRNPSGEDLTNEQTGQGNLEIANENLEDEAVIYTSPFQSSHTRKHGNAATGFITAAEIPIMETGIDTNDPGLRLLMVRDPRSYEPDIDLGAGATPDYKIGYFEDVDGLEGKDASFRHALTIAYPTLLTYLQKAKTVTHYYFLTVVDIASLDLFKLIFDSGSYYLINTVENFVPGQVTKVQLFKVS